MQEEKRRPAGSDTKESAAEVVREQLVPEAEPRTKWVLFGLERRQRRAGLASEERRQNQRRPTGRWLYKQEGKPQEQSRGALASLMTRLGLKPCRRGGPREDGPL